MRWACWTSWCRLLRVRSLWNRRVRCWGSPIRGCLIRCWTTCWRDGLRKRWPRWIAWMRAGGGAGAELRQVVRGLMEGCRDRLVAALTRRDQVTARRLSGVMDALLHLDGEVRLHAEPRFLVEATLARLAVEAGGEAAPVSSPAPAALRAATPVSSP